jgi:hypothetical protein
VPVIPAAQRTPESISITLGNRYLPRLVVGRPIVFNPGRRAPRIFDRETVRELQGEVNSLLSLAWSDHPPQTYEESFDEELKAAHGSEYS